MGKTQGETKKRARTSAPRTLGAMPTHAKEPGQRKYGATVSRVDLTKEKGDPGTNMYGGYSAVDYNSDFNGNQAIRTFEEMRKSDATIKATLLAVKLPVVQAEYFVMPADANDPKEVEIAEFVKENLEGIEGGFRRFLREALGYLDFGFYYFEKVYRIEKSQVRLSKLAPRLPSAHMKWMMDGDPETPGVTQLLPNVGQGKDISTTPQIPMSKLVLFTNEQEGDNFAGVSILRSAYKHWFIKDTLYRIDTIKHERGAGVLIITTPDGNSDEDIAKAEELGTRFKLNENAYIVKPGSKESGWDIDLLTKGIADQSSALMDSVNHHNREIVKNILAMFLDLGAQSTGSYALSKDQTDFFGLAEQATADYVAERLNTQLVKEMVIMNFGEREKYPQLQFGKIGSVDYAELSEALSKLVTAGLVGADPKMKEWTRKTFGLPEVSAEDLEDEEEIDEQGKDPEDAEPDETDPHDHPMPPGKGGGKMPPPSKDKGKQPPKPVADDGSAEPKDGEDVDEAEMAEGSFKSWRPLTLAEGRVQFADLNKYFDDEESTLAEELAAITAQQKQATLKQLEKLYEAGDIAAITALTVSAGAALAAALKAAAAKALEKGKTTAANEIRGAIPTTTGFTKRVLGGKVDILVSQHQTELENALKGKAIDLLNNEVGKAAAINELEGVFDAITDAGVDDMSASVIAEFINEGRALSFLGNKDGLHAMQRSEVLDDKTCNVCLSLDGRVLGVNDPFTLMGEVHTNCRGIWVAILKTDADLPDPKQLPRTLQNRFQTTEGVPNKNNFDQMKQPIIRKGSRLDKAIKDGKMEV